eukprot:365186-Chlamydomonas_euryale.AAC.2
MRACAYASGGWPFTQRTPCMQMPMRSMDDQRWRVRRTPLLRACFHLVPLTWASHLHACMRCAKSPTARQLYTPAICCHGRGTLTVTSTSHPATREKLLPSTRGQLCSLLHLLACSSQVTRQHASGSDPLQAPPVREGAPVATRPSLDTKRPAPGLRGRAACSRQVRDSIGGGARSVEAPATGRPLPGRCCVGDEATQAWTEGPKSRHACAREASAEDQRSTQERGRTLRAVLARCKAQCSRCTGRDRLVRFGLWFGAKTCGSATTAGRI